MLSFFITYLGGRTEKMSFATYEEANIWFTAHADEVIGVSEIAC